jgi:hypothetical protein
VPGGTCRTARAAGARDQYAAPLPIRERVLGLEHPATLNARHQLTYWTRKAEGAAASGRLASPSAGSTGRCPGRVRVQGQEELPIWESVGE